MREGGSNDTSPPKTLPSSGRGRYRAAGRLRLRLGASLSVTAGALDRDGCPRRPGRYARAPVGFMAVGAIGPAVRYRESDGGRLIWFATSPRSRASSTGPLSWW